MAQYYVNAWSGWKLLRNNKCCENDFSQWCGKVGKVKWRSHDICRFLMYTCCWSYCGSLVAVSVTVSEKQTWTTRWTFCQNKVNILPKQGEHLTFKWPWPWNLGIGHVQGVIYCDYTHYGQVLCKCMKRLKSYCEKTKVLQTYGRTYVRTYVRRLTLYPRQPIGSGIMNALSNSSH